MYVIPSCIIKSGSFVKLCLEKCTEHNLWFGAGFCNGQADYSPSQLLKSVLDASGFSFAEIEFKQYSEIFFKRYNRMLCVSAYTIYVGSRTEGILGRLYYSVEESDIDAILPFFEEYDVYDAQYYLDEGIEKPDINEDPWEYITGYHTLLCSRKSLFAFYDEEFPGYMKIYCLPNTHFSSSKVPARGKHVYIENTSFQHLVKKTDAKDFNITTETTNHFQTNGPAVTERCFSSSYLFSLKQDSLFNYVLEICVDIIQKEIKITPPKQIRNKINKINGKLGMLLLQLDLGQQRKFKEAILATSTSYYLHLAFTYRRFLLSDANYILDEFENGMFVNPYFKVTYMTAELMGGSGCYTTRTFIGPGKTEEI
ncbi:unnamed protein product [Mytilus coruscus]|uniref:Uncharacterized protein n=1 Tax=Mytilus coruscus TaxID=42192 RepID=A0A6J8EAY2_MYTCO|nr:unnamed protein product [Mytilus coruscus]